MARKPKPAPPITFWERCKQITAYQVVVVLLSVGSSLAPVYVVMKSVAASAADNYVQKKLKQHGLDPPEVKAALNKLKEIDQLKAENLAVQSDLATVKAQNRQLQELLEKLLEAELNNN